MLPRPPTSTLFPYTTLFRSKRGPARLAAALYEETPESIAGREQSAQERRLSRPPGADLGRRPTKDRKSTRLNSSHQIISYAVFCLKKKKQTSTTTPTTSPNP